MNLAITLTLIGVIVVVTVNIVIVSRWSGRIDGYMVAIEKRMQTAEDEIRRLREARHTADGHIQRHEGLLRELDRRQIPRWADSQDGA